MMRPTPWPADFEHDHDERQSVVSAAVMQFQGGRETVRSLLPVRI